MAACLIGCCTGAHSGTRSAKASAGTGVGSSNASVSVGAGCMVKEMPVGIADAPGTGRTCTHWVEQVRRVHDTSGGTGGCMSCGTVTGGVRGG